MDYQKASQLQNLLTEAYLARPRNLVFSFNVAGDDNLETLAADHRTVVGISQRKREDGSFARRLFSTVPEPAFDRAGLSKQLGINSADLELIVTDGINAFNAPIQTRVRPAPVGCSVESFHDAKCPDHPPVVAKPEPEPLQP